MELDGRKVTILKAIIKTYLETGEPVGSRTISKFSDLKLSSATIRNEMSDLEEMGYIVQPHTSAGRIPSDKGYRFYVDQLMEEKDQQLSQVQELMIQRVDRLELVLKRLVQMLASNTNYAAMISGPQSKENKIKFIQLSKMEAEKLLVVLVMEGNIFKNSVITLNKCLEQADILNLNILLNSSLNGLSLAAINLSLINRMKDQAGRNRDIIELIISQIGEALEEDSDEIPIYTSGAMNIFKYPELSDGEKASQLLGTLEQKEVLKELISDVNVKEENAGTGIQVYIGDEMPVQTMKDCSIVTANYAIGDSMRGTIGIIGPKRMDYDKVVNTLRQVMSQLDVTFNQAKKGDTGVPGQAGDSASGSDDS